MYFVILGRDRPDSAAARAQARPAHLARLEVLDKEGRMLLAGPLSEQDSPHSDTPRMIGSLIVAEFPAAEEARPLDPGEGDGTDAEPDVPPHRAPH